MIIRDLYLNQIRPFYNKKIIKVIVGIRRSGKSTLMNQIKDELLKKEISEEQIIFLNFCPLLAIVFLLIFDAQFCFSLHFVHLKGLSIIYHTSFYTKKDASI